MNFFVQTVVERTPRGQRATVQENNYTGHIYVRQDGLASVIVTDAEYPQRVAFSILGKILDEFTQKFPTKQITPGTTSTLYPQLRDHLNKAQDPQSSDPFMKVITIIHEKVQKELDETKIILHKTMESLLQRGEQLDDLVQRSDQLSAQSKMFYKTAKRYLQAKIVRMQDAALTLDSYYFDNIFPYQRKISPPSNLHSEIGFQATDWS